MFAIAFAGLLVGLALLTWSADQFVIGAARVAARLRLSTVVIGAVVIGFGTSAPEIVVSSIAAGQGKLDIAVGNIIGSNVANLSMVLGAAALVLPITVAGTTLRREAPISLGATIIFAVLVRDGLTRADGAIMFFTLVVALGVILTSARGGGDSELAAEVSEFLDEDTPPKLAREVVRTLAGLLGTMAAAQLLVINASSLARSFGLAEGFIGLTIVAIGTSLPELATSMQAARKGETDLIIGNLLGSNLFNSLAVGGAAALVGPGLVESTQLTGLALYFMLTISVLATVFMITGAHVVRAEGIILLTLYVASLPLLAESAPENTDGTAAAAPSGMLIEMVDQSGQLASTATRSRD